jgi:5-(carboxyamino)imidazole ribonucleotide synthase
VSEAKQLSRPLAPGAAIGILGGGQLGRMLALAAARLGFKAHIYSDQPDAPAFQVAAVRTFATYHDKSALEAFAKSIAVATFEFENVPDAAAAALSAHVPVAPAPRALAIAQDRLAEKKFLSGLGIATAPFESIENEKRAEDAFRAIGGPLILKTCRLGYDGKGQKQVANAQEARAAFAAFKGVPAILEKVVDFAFEASVIAARGRDGHFAAYDPPENEHGDNILRRSTVPSRLTPAQIAAAIAIAQTIMDALDYVGVLCVELFVTKNGKLLVNEIAPRVHNSGHWTMEACVTSQFQQHIRAIAGWPLGEPKRHSDAVMENIIGDELKDWLKLAAEPAGLDLYGKTEVRPMRKMGHITRLSPLGTLKRK